MHIEIRRAAPGQAGILTEIAVRAKRYWDYPETWIQKWMPELTFTPDQIKNEHIYAAYDGDQVVGFYRLILHAPKARLEDLWVKPDAIGTGVGRELFLHALSICRSRGLSALDVESDPHAQGFYERMGMRKVGERPSGVDGQRSLPVLEVEL